MMGVPAGSPRPLRSPVPPQSWGYVLGRRSFRQAEGETTGVTLRAGKLPGQGAWGVDQGCAEPGRLSLPSGAGFQTLQGLSWGFCTQSWWKQSTSPKTKQETREERERRKRKGRKLNSEQEMGLQGPTEAGRPGAGETKLGNHFKGEQRWSGGREAPRETECRHRAPTMVSMSTSSSEARHPGQLPG